MRIHREYRHPCAIHILDADFPHFSRIDWVGRDSGAHDFLIDQCLHSTAVLPPIPPWNELRENTGRLQSSLQFVRQGRDVGFSIIYRNKQREVVIIGSMLIIDMDRLPFPMPTRTISPRDIWEITWPSTEKCQPPIFPENWGSTRHRSRGYTLDDCPHLR